MREKSEGGRELAREKSERGSEFVCVFLCSFDTVPSRQRVGVGEGRSGRGETHVKSKVGRSRISA